MILHKAGGFLLEGDVSAEHQAKCPSYKAQSILQQTLPTPKFTCLEAPRGNTPQTVARVCRQHKQAAGRQHKAGKAVVVGAAGPQPSPFLEAAIKSLQK